MTSFVSAVNVLVRPVVTNGNVTFVDKGFKKWKYMTFVKRLSNFSEIDKFKYSKAFSCTLSISLSFFPEPIYNDIYYQERIKEITPHVLHSLPCPSSEPTQHDIFEIVDMFSILQAIYVFLSVSGQRH